MAAPTISTVTILAGASLSNGLSVTTGTIIRIFVPPEWSSAALSFLISADNVAPYSPVCFADGKERVITAQPNSMILGSIIPGGWIKLRSGTIQKSIPQLQKCDFRISVAP